MRALDLLEGQFIENHWIFGFRDERELFDWFQEPEMLRLLSRGGFVVRRYHGSVTHGEYQSVLDIRAPYVCEDTQIRLTATAARKWRGK